jgi:hypothetical protein
MDSDVASDFACTVVRLSGIKKHPNADTLSIVEIEGCPVVIRTQDFIEGQSAIYLPVESMIPEGRDWVKTFCSHLKFKGGFHRVKALRLRGVFSMGMLVPIAARPPSAIAPPSLGIDLAPALGVAKYEEPEEVGPPPSKAPAPLTRWGRFVLFLCRLLRLKNKRRRGLTKPMPTYGVSQYRKYKHLFQVGEEVQVTCKIHGTSFAFGWHKGQFWVSSHKVLRPVEDNSVYWKAVRKYDLKERTKGYPDLMFYGEIYGPGIQDMEYGVAPGDLGLLIFDVYQMKTGRYLAVDALKDTVSLVGLVTVPLLYRGPYDAVQIEAMKDGPSLIGPHFREGVVIKPVKERVDHCGRVILKLIGETYLLRKDGREGH